MFRHGSRANGVGCGAYDRAIAKARTTYICSGCSHRALAWSGQCAGCGEWNTLERTVEAGSPGGVSATAAKRAAAGPGAAPVPLRSIDAERHRRLATGIPELDRVLGGGLVPGSLVLLGGAPGIGKSTLAAMALANIGAAEAKVLYASGEESAAQVRSRAERLGDAALDIPMLAEPSLEVLVGAIESERPAVCVIDSVQTITVGDATPGSVSAVREATSALMEIGKRLSVTMILIGHVTKEGSLAGPRALEHLVDVVLTFDGERERTFRTVRATKNRFGATSEVGVFEMRDSGLVEVVDPSARFAGDAEPAPGSVVLCAMEGTRPMLVEIQALVAPTEIVPPRRTATGIDRNRLALVIAVLGRHAGIQLGQADVFVNVAGGIRIDEPGADLAVALALASAHRGEALESGGRPLACFGEIGLTGELRYVPHADRRAAEAAKFGLAPVLAPQAGSEGERGVRPVAAIRDAVAVAKRAGLRSAA